MGRLTGTVYTLQSLVWHSGLVLTCRISVPLRSRQVTLRTTRYAHKFPFRCRRTLSEAASRDVMDAMPISRTSSVVVLTAMAAAS